MIYTELTNKALKISFEAHKNQVDKSGVPYIFHPYEVASSLKEENEICVALLHDVVEDSDITLQDLAKDFPPQIIEAIKLLTHDEKVPYLEYVKKIKTNKIATNVKLSDLHHNSRADRLVAVTEEDLQRLEKYKTAIQILEN